MLAQRLSRNGPRLLPSLESLSQSRKQGLDGLRNTLNRQRFAAVDSETMKQWLSADLMPRGIAVDSALPITGQLWNESPPQHSDGGELIYNHKKVFHSLYNMEAWSGSKDDAPPRKPEGIFTDDHGMRRQHYLVHETTSTKGEATSHYNRHYPAIPEKWDEDPLMMALRRLFGEVMSSTSQLEMGIQPPAGATLFQFCYRTVHSLAGDNLKGDPGPEGIHNDGGTAAMIVVMRRDNIKPQTGGTRIWSMRQDTGKPTEADLESEKLLYTWLPSEPLEALFFLDESVKHEALQGELIDPASEGLRDMFIMDVRRKDGSFHACVE